MRITRIWTSGVCKWLRKAEKCKVGATVCMYVLIDGNS